MSKKQHAAVPQNERRGNGRPDRKAARRLAERLNDYVAMKAATQHEGKVAARLASGGYHAPGSRQRS